MIEVKSIDVSPINKSSFAISWKFEPTIEKLSDYRFSLEKSEAPHDGYEFLANINPASNYYIDDDIAIFKLWKSYYVRLKIESLDGADASYSRFGTVEHPPNLEALELIRRTDITLKNPRYGNGIECSIFLRKEGGQRCQECFDALKRRSTKSNCVNCYGTTYDGGFFKAVKAFVNFSVDAKSMGVADIGSNTRSANRVMLSNYPKIKPGDVIIDMRLNRVWSVTEIQQIERRRHVIKQIATCEEEERTSVLLELLKRGD